MDKKRYMFVGTRFFCVEKMLQLGLDVVCYAVIKDSVVANELSRRNIEYTEIENKKHLISIIENTDFDILVSNGCPYIIPVSKLQKENQLFINIHPSLLPDLKGINPVNGAILFDRPQGATCHMMDDGIDTGSIIAQVKVCDKPDMPLDLLYQLSFLAESEAFLNAYEKDFTVEDEIINKQDEYIYYSRKLEDQIINNDDNLEMIFRKVRAFQLDNQYARIIKDDHTYYVKDLVKFDTYLFDNKDYKNNQIIFIYKDNVITRYDDIYLLWRLDNIEHLNIGDMLLS